VLGPEIEGEIAQGGFGHNGLASAAGSTPAVDRGSGSVRRLGQAAEEHWPPPAKLAPACSATTRSCSQRLPGAGDHAIGTPQAGSVLESKRDDDIRCFGLVKLETRPIVIAPARKVHDRGRLIAQLTNGSAYFSAR
jgi:hypothetical protein